MKKSLQGACGELHIRVDPTVYRPNVEEGLRRNGSALTTSFFKHGKKPFHVNKNSRKPFWQIEMSAEVLP